MESFLIKLLQLILALSLLVIIHEFGHFIWARIFKIKVEKFYLFFNPWFSLFKWKPKNSDTTYGIGWVPLGGYVKIAGMIDESMDTEQMKQPAQPWEFRAKPAWQRLLVMTGGVLNNFILAIIIYAGIAWYWGEKYIPFEDVYEGMNFTPAMQNLGFENGDVLLMADGKPIDSSMRSAYYKILDANRVTVRRHYTDTIDINLPANAVTTIPQNDPLMRVRVPVIIKAVMGGPANKAGAKEGDHIIAIGDVTTPSFNELTDALQAKADSLTTVTMVRGNDTIVADITPDSDGKIGIQLANPFDVYGYKDIKYSLLGSIPQGVKSGTDQLVTYVSSLKHLADKNGAQNLGGFGSIGQLFPSAWDWRTFWEMCAFLSIILAFMNIIPIPALDGGHVMFLLWEVVTRRKPSEKFMEYAQMVGMAFLFALLIYANFNDIYRFLIK